MRFSVATAVLMAGAAAAEPLTTITPCPGQNVTSAAPITVTKQYQTVSTCATTSACLRGSCITNYPFEKFAYVSTVIPAAWNGAAAAPTTVTSTTQEVTVSRFHTTITKFVTPTPTATINGTTHRASPSPVYLTIAKDFYAAYNKLGPLAIPGWGGSDLCDECKVKSDGSRSQVVEVVECRSGPDGAKCMGYEETWISKPAPVVSSKAVVPVSTKFVAPSAGTFTFTFTLTAPSRVITAGPQTITVAPSPYYHHVTRGCRKAFEIIDFTVTVTKTIYWTVPCVRQPPKTSHVLPVPTGHHALPGFDRPGKGPSPGGHHVGGDPFEWADWGSDDVTNPHLPLPNKWADWILTNTVTQTVTSVVYPTTTGGPIPGSTTSSFSTATGSTTSSSSAATVSSSTSSASTSSSSSSFSGGPISGSTSTSGTSTSAESTTTSSISTSSSSSSFTGGPISGSTTTSASTTSESSTSASTTSESSTSASTTSESSTSASTTSESSTSASTTSESSTSASTTSESTTSASTTSESSTSASTTSESSTSASTTSESSTSASTTSESTTSASTTSESTTSASTTSESTTSASTTSESTTSASTTSESTTTATTTTATTTTSGAAEPSSTTFFITVNSPSKYRKRALNYITFSGEDGVLTGDRGQAAPFFLDTNGYLRNGLSYVEADFSQPYIAFSLTTTVTATISTWTLSSESTLVLNVNNLGFCAATSGNVFILFTSQTPFQCFAIILTTEPATPTTSSSSTTVVPSTTAESTTTASPTTTPSLTTTASPTTTEAPTSTTEAPTTTTTGAPSSTSEAPSSTTEAPTTTTSEAPSSTTEAPTTTTSEAQTTTTTTADVSGDLGSDPTPGPVRRGIQYGSHRYYYHHRRQQHV